MEREESEEAGNIIVTHQVNFILLGNSGVGKTEFANRCRSPNNKFNSIGSATIGVDFFSFYAPHPTNKRACAHVNVWDTAGQERFDAVIRGYFRKADGVIFVFDLTRRESFDSIRTRWLPTLLEQLVEARADDVTADEATEAAGAPVESLLVGNKLDLVRDNGTARAVDYEEANRYATDELRIPYVEFSCKESNYVDIMTPLDWLVSLVFRNKRLEAKTRLPTPRLPYSRPNGVPGKNPLGSPALNHVGIRVNGKELTTYGDTDTNDREKKSCCQ